MRQRRRKAERSGPTRRLIQIAVPGFVIFFGCCWPSRPAWPRPRSGSTATSRATCRMSRALKTRFTATSRPPSSTTAKARCSTRSSIRAAATGSGSSCPSVGQPYLRHRGDRRQDVLGQQRLRPARHCARGRRHPARRRATGRLRHHPAGHQKCGAAARRTRRTQSAPPRSKSRKCCSQPRSPGVTKKTRCWSGISTPTSTATWPMASNPPSQIYFNKKRPGSGSGRSGHARRHPAITKEKPVHRPGRR